MAIIYDFDGTLAPGRMQDRQFIPDIGLETGQFWAEVNQLTEKQQADSILMYMYSMLEKARAAGKPVRYEDLATKSREIHLFPGVEDWFDRMNLRGLERGLPVEHYVISSGNAEIIENSPVAPNFKRIYASRFLYDDAGLAVWPAVAVNFTAKTQYLFRINKGAHDQAHISLINRYVPQEERPVPFENIVYIGDGETDVPCFRLVKDLGGLSVAVYDHDNHREALQYLREGRVNAIAPAAYQPGGPLDRIVSTYMNVVAARQAHRRAAKAEQRISPSPKRQQFTGRWNLTHRGEDEG